MRPFRTVRAVRACPAKLTIVVAVVAIGAENLRSHTSSLSNAIQIQHVGQQTGLGQSTAASVGNWVARGARNSKLRDHVQEVARRNQPHRRIPEYGIHRFSRAGPMTAQTILELINGRIHRRNSVGRAHSGQAVLRGTRYGRWRKRGHLIRSVAVVAVRAGGVAVAVQHQALGGIVRIGSRRNRMSDLGKFRKNIHGARRHVGAATVARHTVLLIRSTQEPR